MSRGTEILYKGSRITGKHDTPECEPIYLTNAFNVSDLDELDFVYDGGGYAYNRTCNPNRTLLAESMTYLEGGEDTLICNCGMSAITTALQTLVKAGDHILSDRTLYGETIDVISRVLGKFGVEVTYIDFADLDQVRAGIRPQHPGALHGDGVQPHDGHRGHRRRGGDRPRPRLQAGGGQYLYHLSI